MTAAHPCTLRGVSLHKLAAAMPEDTMTTLPSFGELRFKIPESNDSTNVITLNGKNMRQKAPARASSLYNEGETYEAIEIKNNYENFCNVYKVVFPRQAVLNNIKK